MIEITDLMLGKIIEMKQVTAWKIIVTMKLALNEKSF
jgi:hypothetical protein